MSCIFISHRTTDSDIADMLLDFLVATGIDRNKVFCSSLPGNEVKKKISTEIKSAIKESIVNIAILSKDYNKSAYCLNEAGILWFQDVPTIVIALPDILLTDMIGFLNGDYKLRRLDNNGDIAAIHDEITDAIKSTSLSATVLTREISKLNKRYIEYIKSIKPTQKIDEINAFESITTDDERIVLYYMLSHNIRKVKQNDISKWLIDKEIHDVNIENAFDLLSTIGCSSSTPTLLELDIETFRKLSTDPNELVNNLNQVVEKHRKLSKFKFENMWDSEQFDSSNKLFISYIIDEQVSTFGTRWMADAQINCIKDWESKYSLENKLSLDYDKCLNNFINNNFIYASSWTSYGNPREYTLHKSLKEFLFNKNFPYINELNKNKNIFYFEVPF